MYRKATMRIRAEVDSLGAVELPADALYGAQTARAVANYPISGFRAHPVFIKSYALLKLACAEVNGNLGLIPKPLAQAIIHAARNVASGLHHDQFVVDVYQAGAGVSFHMNVNEVIANLAIIEMAKRRKSIPRLGDHSLPSERSCEFRPVHQRYVSNRGAPGHLVAPQRILPGLHDLEEAFRKKAVEFDRILKSGRTHLQDAVPIRLGQEFAAYGEALRQAAAQIRTSAETLRALGISRSAAGTGLNVHPRFSRLVVSTLSQLTGLKLSVATDLRAAMQSQLPLATVSGALRNLALELIRIANDLRLLASGPVTGLNEITLPPVQPGSSIMPGKVNPAIAEMLDMVAFQVVGCDTVVALAVQAGQLELNVMMPAIVWNLLQAIEILKNACRVSAERCIRGITANRDACERYAYRTPGLATALNPVLGYDRAALVVKKALTSAKSTPEVCREEKLIPEVELKRVLNPHRVTEPGIRVISRSKRGKK
jgi:aspartate ammonia-lyase